MLVINYQLNIRVIPKARNNTFYMPLKNKVAAITSFFLVSYTTIAQAQSLVTDSLQQVLKTAGNHEKPVVMAELARATVEKNIDASIANAGKALIMAKENADADATAFCYATMGYLLMQKNQQHRASLFIDSAVQIAAKSKNNVLVSFAWLRKGWLELVKGNNEKAMSGLLKAEQLIQYADGRRAFSYKTLINHYIASIYAYGSDTLKQRKYAYDCLSAAKQSLYPDDLLLGYMTLGHSFFSAFEKNRSRRVLLDSSMVYYRIALATYRHNAEKILLQSNASATALNIANSYFKYYPPAYKDSANNYVNMALDIARRTNGKEIIANCYGILSEYALRDGSPKKAEQYLLTGISELKDSAPGVAITRSRLMLGLANVAEKSGDKTKALDYYKKYIDYYSKVFDSQKLATVQQLEEEYQSVLKENEIARLRERADFNKQLNWLYVAIGSASIILLGLLLSSYHYKLKASQQQKQLTEQEKEEIKLLAQLQQAEAQRLMLEKQEAELQVSLREKEHAHAKAQQELLQDRTEWLEKELLAGSLKIEEKNAILELLKEKSRKADSPAVARQMGRIINQNLRMDKSIDEQQVISQSHPGFFNALQQQAENSLTRLDLKYCSYILMGLDTKEIANRLGVEPKSIRMARYRLKQKLKLAKDDDLDQFIGRVG
jgi:DNA-binding CsgD family transcriptional regulator